MVKELSIRVINNIAVLSAKRGKDIIMSSNVNWFVLEEEYTIGSAKVNGKDVFITEESIRFDAPRVMIHETLREAVMQICSLDEDDLEIPEEKEYFEKELKRAEKAYKS